MKRASGTFEVKSRPLPSGGPLGDLALGRMGFDKQWQGDFEGTSQVEMTTAGTSVEGSAAYVALERLTGTLGGRRGSFTAAHLGTMRRGVDYELTIKIVPDSGTGELQDLAGTITIAIEKGRHSYAIDYTLPAR